MFIFVYIFLGFVHGDNLARTIYNEARGEGRVGMDSVASTIQNRAKMDRSYMGGNNYDTICQKGYDGYKAPLNINGPADKAAFNYAQQLANNMRSGNFKVNHDYTHFDTSRNSFKKYEGPNLVYQGQQGNHYFWKER